MRAMVLAAGLGTRLRPLTDDRPKALVEVGGRTLLEITLSRLRSVGVHDVIINVHHFAETIHDYLRANGNFGMHIEVSHEPVLLDTGGGLKKASHFFLRDFSTFEEPFILHNVDVISTIDLRQMMESHIQSHELATLAVQERETSRYLLFDEKQQLCGRRSGSDPKSEMVQECGTALAFCGVHVISPRIFEMMTEEGAFSIITTYLRLAASGEKISAFRADAYYWRDVGRPEQVRQAARDLEQKVLLPD